MFVNCEIKTFLQGLEKEKKYIIIVLQLNFHGDVLDFDRMLDGNRLRVRALFSVINEQNKLSANNNVVVADFSRARALAA